MGNLNVEQVKAEMDAAAEVAEKEFKAMAQNITVPVARWMQKHYMKAGYKRLGKVMVAFAKAMEKTTEKDWAEADSEE